MTRVWEFGDNRAMPSDLVREQDFILKLRRLQRLATPHFVVNIRLSAVEALHKSLKIFEEVVGKLQNFAKITNGTYADMSNGDAFIIWEESADSPLLLDRLGSVLEASDKVITTYQMPADYMSLRERVNAYVEEVHASQANPLTANAPSDALKSEAARGPLTAWSVDQIGKLISDIDMKPYLHTQHIYHYEMGQFKPFSTEYFFSFEELKRERFPKLDLIAPEHLFLALCEIIDQKLLSQFIEAPDTLKGRAVNLNLSIATVLNSTFAQFVHSIPHSERQLINFELHRGDLFQDLGRTLGAIDTLKNEGFRVTLDSITPDMIPYLNLAAFNADFIKINVAKERGKLLSNPHVLKDLQKLPLDRVVFFRCDNADALSEGMKIGVILYQGWHIDEIVSGKT
jgi:hypothetical protein